MPEGDTTHRAAARLRAALLDRVLTRVEVPRATGPLPRPGEHVTGVQARGKHLLVEVGELTIHTHQRMTGSWRLHRPGERWHASAAAVRVVLGVEDAVAICVASPVVEVLDRRALARHPVLRQLGPDLCDPDVDLTAAQQRLRAGCDPQRPLGEALLDQRLVAGVGNVYRSEVLFLTGLHPQTRVGAVDDETLARALAVSARLLRDNLGRARRTTVPRAPDGTLWVYGRTRRPCRRCGTPIEQAQVGEPSRVVHWCPTCQPSHR